MTEERKERYAAGFAVHVCAATVVAELGTPEDFESPRQVLALAGMDLSGHQSSLRGSKRGRPVLRRELYLLAGPWVHPTRGLYRTQCEAMLARNGDKKTKAVCKLAPHPSPRSDLHAIVRQAPARPVRPRHRRRRRRQVPPRPHRPPPRRPSAARR